MSINYVYDSQNQRWMEPIPNTEGDYFVRQCSQPMLLTNAITCMTCSTGIYLCCIGEPILSKIWMGVGACFYLTGRVLKQTNRSQLEALVQDYISKNGWKDFSQVTPPPGSLSIVVNYHPV